MTATPTASPPASPPASAADPRDGGRELARVRTDAGVTQRAVAAVLGVRVRTLQGWEQGRYRPPTDAAQRWRDACTEAARRPESGPPARSGTGRRPATVDPAWLIRTRKEAGAARTWLAPALGVASRTIQSWEDGKIAAPADIADRWPDACAEAARLAQQAAEQRIAERKAAER